MAEHSKYQQKIIRNYYQNREAISLQRVQELVTELYLATGKKRAKLWDSLPGHLEKLGVKKTRNRTARGTGRPGESGQASSTADGQVASPFH